MDLGKRGLVDWMTKLEMIQLGLMEREFVFSFGVIGREHEVIGCQLIDVLMIGLTKEMVDWMGLEFLYWITENMVGCEDLVENGSGDWIDGVWLGGILVYLGPKVVNCLLYLGH